MSGRARAEAHQKWKTKNFRLVTTGRRAANYIIQSRIYWFKGFNSLNMCPWRSLVYNVGDRWRSSLPSWLEYCTVSISRESYEKMKRSCVVTIVTTTKTIDQFSIEIYNTIHERTHLRETLSFAANEISYRNHDLKWHVFIPGCWYVKSWFSFYRRKPLTALLTLATVTESHAYKYIII